MKSLMSITVHGAEHEWSFTFYGDTKNLPIWREDGLEIDEIVNTVPAWVPYGLVKPYVWLQDLFNFKL